MKKLVLLVLCVSMLVSSLCVHAESLPVDVSIEVPQAFSFRNGVTWGMTQKEVIALEGEPTSTNADNTMLIYANVTSAGKKAVVGYTFSSGTLATIVVLFQEKHSSDNLYIQDFDDIDESLTAKYGEPALDRNLNWIDDLFMGDEKNYGLAVSCGDLSIASIWDTENLQIVHTLEGDNYQIEHGMVYSYSLTHEKTAPNTDGI